MIGGGSGFIVKTRSSNDDSSSSLYFVDSSIHWSIFLVINILGQLPFSSHNFLYGHLRSHFHLNWSPASFTVSSQSNHFLYLLVKFLCAILYSFDNSLGHFAFLTSSREFICIFLFPHPINYEAFFLSTASRTKSSFSLITSITVTFVFS
ncbi:hypothetical protein E2C01_043746 [Portunus trituberculatus]|uniref:Uncharacterized protein n=1 Tax=Portunus trituberculatus TaxID=210409 RepID=A0A5B7FR26_PORTR|nr:hypothetical protein [Portunus trituberculatus]